MPLFVEQTLQAAFPGRVYLSLGEGLSLVPGRQPKHPDNAGYQRFLRGTYPFPTRLVAGQRVVSVLDIVRSLSDDTIPPPTPCRRGRRRKIAVTAP